MDLFWRENKRFLLGVGAALLVGLLFHILIIGPAREAAAAARAENRTIQEKLTKLLEGSGQPTSEILDRARGDLERLEKHMRSVVTDLTVAVPAELVIPKSEKTPGFFFDTQLNRIKGEMKRKAPKAGPDGVRIPADPFVFPPSPDSRTAPEFLLRLALVTRIVQAAFDAPVAEVMSLQPLPGLAQGAQEFSPNAGLFIQRHPVDTQFRASFEKFLHVLHGLNQKGAFLAVERVRFAKEDQMAPTGLVEISASGLTFNIDGALQGSAPGTDSGGGGGRPSGFRPRGRG